MDFFTYTDNETLATYDVVSRQTGKVADVLNNILMVFLIIYKVRKGNEEVKDFHEPIFRQLFYIEIGIVISRNLLWVMLALNLHEKLPTIYNFLCLSLWSIDNLLITITLMLTFLAALQRIVIMYMPNWKHLVTGEPLAWFITALWLLSLFQLFTKLTAMTTSKSWFNTITISFRIVFLLSTIASNLIYYHFYKLMSNFTDQHQYHRMHLLYQFVPIHTILTIFSFFQLVNEFLLTIYPTSDVCWGFYICAGEILTPFIPTVISLSYIASRDNLRALITAVMRPIWEDITG